jgi:hypothetical protein
MTPTRKNRMTVGILGKLRKSGAPNSSLNGEMEQPMEEENALDELFESPASEESPEAPRPPRRKIVRPQY